MDLMEVIYKCMSQAVEKDVDEVKSFPADENLSDYGLNSLDFIKFLVLIEEEFDFTFNDSDILFDNFNTINKITDMIKKYIG
jgi:acyl carrier protein